MVSINLIDFYSETAKCKQAITIRQMGIIARQLYEIKKLLAGWMRSNKKYWYASRASIRISCYRKQYCCKNSCNMLV